MPAHRSALVPWRRFGRPGWVALGALALLASPAARAGARPYAYVQGVDSLPEHAIELEGWFSSERPHDLGPGGWDWWTGPVVGITDHVEVGLFAVLAQPGGAFDAPPPLALDSLRLQLSWLLADKGAWPIDVRLRLELGPRISQAADSTLWLQLLLARDLGPLNLTLNLGPWLEKSVALSEAEPYLRAALGASLEVGGGLRLGGEFVGDYGTRETKVYAGPSLAWGRGRIWVSAHVGAGLTEDSGRYKGRLVLGLFL